MVNVFGWKFTAERFWNWLFDHTSNVITHVRRDIFQQNNLSLFVSLLSSADENIQTYWPKRQHCQFLFVPSEPSICLLFSNTQRRFEVTLYKKNPLRQAQKHVLKLVNKIVKLIWNNRSMYMTVRAEKFVQCSMTCDSKANLITREKLLSSLVVLTWKRKKAFNLKMASLPCVAFFLFPIPFCLTQNRL